MGKVKYNIKIKTLLLILFCYSAGACTTQNNTNKSAVSRFLLLDSRIISDTENARLELGVVQKSMANPLFVEDKAWEMRFDNLYGNVIYDEEEHLYKCWYSPFIVDSSAQGMTLKERNRGYQPPKNREMGICYAISKDGINWEKPNLGLVAYNGSKQNNIVWRGPHGAGIFKDMSEKNPAKRYKMIFLGLSVSFSQDGLHWINQVDVEGVDVAGDTHNNALWAPDLHKFVGITRTWRKVEGKREREVARIESDDFIHWSREKVVLQGTDFDLQPYAMPVFQYAGLYIGLVAIHQQSIDRVWTELAWSPDTRIWHRINPGTPLIPNSEKELDYDYGCAYPCAYPIFKKDEIRLYYGGSDWLHFGWRNGALCLATLRPDGFAGYKDGNADLQSSVTTTVIDYKGQSIGITADCDKGGRVNTLILDTNGKEIAKAEVVLESVTDQLLHFNEDIKLDSIRLRFEFHKAKLYSFILRL